MTIFKTEQLAYENRRLNKNQYLKILNEFLSGLSADDPGFEVNKNDIERELKKIRNHFLGTVNRRQ